MKYIYIIIIIIASCIYIAGKCSQDAYQYACLITTLAWIAYCLDGILCKLKNK